MASKNTPSRTAPEIWARRTANRLRLIQASFLDQGEDQRRLHIEDEIEFALDELDLPSDEERQRVLRCLEDCFPVYSEGVPAGAGDSGTAAEGGDPVAGFLDHYRSLGAAGKEQVMARLAAEGVVAADGGSPAAGRLPDGIRLPERAEELADLERAVAQIVKEIGAGGTDDPIDFNRLVKLLGILTSAMRDLHRFIWEFWRQTASRDLQTTWSSSFDRSFEQAVRNYLTNSSEIGSREIASEIERTKRLMLGVCFAVRRGAEEFARTRYQVFAPDNIENAVLIEENASDSAKVKDVGRKSWEKYRQLCRHMTPDSIDTDFNRVFASVITGWLRSRS